MVYLTMLSVAQSRWRNMEERCRGLIWGFTPMFFWRELVHSRKLSQDKPCPDRDSNRTPFE